MAKDHDVVLLAPPGSLNPEPEAPGPQPKLSITKDPQLGKRAPEFDAVLTQGGRLGIFRDARYFAKTRLILDLYDPLPVELPAHYKAHPSPRVSSQSRYHRALRTTRFWMSRADAILVANARQADLYLGMLLGSRRVLLSEIEEDQGWLQRLLEVPCGVVPSVAPPEVSKTPASLSLAWAGGTWPWFDGPSARRLIDSLHQTDSRYELIVLGADPPGGASVYAKAGDLANHPAIRKQAGWLKHQEFLKQLAACRVGLCLAPEGLESRFAHRTRVLDHLAAGIPTVFSGKDPLGEQAAKEGWGIQAPAGDLEALVKATRQLAEEGPAREAALRACHAAASQRTWSASAKPIEDYFKLGLPPRSQSHWLPAVFWHYLRRGEA